jgi:hypothetical protein
MPVFVLVGFGQRDSTGAVLGTAAVGRSHSGEWILGLGFRFAPE